MNAGEYALATTRSREEQAEIDAHKRETWSAASSLDLTKITFSQQTDATKAALSQAAGDNWADTMQASVKEAREQLGIGSSDLLLWEYISDCCPSEEAADRLIQLMRNPKFDSSAVSVPSFKVLKDSSFSCMPESVQFKTWHVQIQGSTGEMVSLYHEDGSPVRLHYRNIWEVALEIFADPSKKGSMCIQPCPQYRQTAGSAGEIPCRIFNVPFSGTVRSSDTRYESDCL
jgi:hypothetical protein